MARMLVRSLCLLAAFHFTVATAWSWNSFGHKAVARIACLELKEGQKQAMFELLKKHPHFGTEFDIFTKDRPDGVEAAEWAILQAATWPDFVRVPRMSHLSKDEIAAHPKYKYHRKFDHFADLPLVAPGF